MHHLKHLVAVCALAALVGCSAEPDDSVSLVQRQGVAGGSSPAPQTAEVPSNHIAQRPSAPQFTSPAQTDDLPLWPPAGSAPPAPVATAPDNSADSPPPPLAANPPAFEPPAFQPPTAALPPSDVAQPQFAPALPAVDPPAAGPALSDPNPLRGSMPPPGPARIVIKTPVLTPSANPLRDTTQDAASLAPPIEHLLPHAPAEPATSPPITPLPAFPVAPNVAAVPELPSATAPTSPAPIETAPSELPPSETPAPLMTLPKPFPKIAVKPGPQRLPKVPIQPQAHAEWSAKQRKLAAEEGVAAKSLAAPEPSGGSAPPSPAEMADMARAYASEAVANPQPRMMTLGTKQDPPVAPSAVEAQPVESSASPPPPPPPPAMPAGSAPPALADPPSFSPPAFDPPVPAAAPPPDHPAAPESMPITELPPAALEVPAAEVTPPAAAPPTATTAIVSPTNSDDPFDVVRVFYGTDRMPVLVNRDTLLMRLIRFTPAAILIALSVVGIGVVIASRKLTWIIGTGTLLVCSTLAVWHGIAETLAIAQLAAQEEPRYSAEKSEHGRIERGICEVSIPKTHDPGELEGPSITRLEFKFDPAEHITLRKTVRLQNDAFYEQLQAQVASSPDRELLVFVHGFNVKFEDAARRTAQMAHDLKLQGAPVFFSWPADQYFLLTYGKDETNVAWSAPHLKEFLLDLVHNTDARAINLVAHSMGNRALTAALRDIDLQFRSEARLFNQVVLAAPDIDADDFRDNIAPAVQRTAKQVTLYASSNDIALSASRLLHRNPRAGDASGGLVIVPGMVTIDVSNINGGPWGHSYYGASDPVLRDLHLLLTSLPPERRTWLNMKELDGQTYWAFKPLGTPSSPAMITPR